MNFPLILLILTVVTGIFWVLERRSFLPARKARAEEAARRFEADNREAIDRGEKAVIDALRHRFPFIQEPCHASII